MNILNKAKEVIKEATMNWPDKPWNKELPDKYVEGKRQQRFQTDMEGRTESQGKCDKCQGPARIIRIYITRKHGGEDGKVYDRWLAQMEVHCGVCGSHRVGLSDEDIDKTYERKG